MGDRLSSGGRSPDVLCHVSVIIPALNEEAQIAECVGSAVAAGCDEVIVVDGGSQDETVSRAQASGAKVIVSNAGRAVQQNAGAAVASGEVFLFLHADCRLLPNSIPAIRQVIDGDTQYVGGCFRQSIDASGFGMFLLERGNALRVRLLGWIYGDQALFVRRDCFEQLGGFQEVGFLEDLEFSRRLNRLGRTVQLTEQIKVSARRWNRVGIVRQTLRNWSIIAAWFCGAAPDRLKRFYPNER